MKWFIKLFFALFPSISFAQNQSESYAFDKKKDFVLTPDSLSRLLTAGYTSDRDKTASIFRWIAENITYNTRPYYNASHLAKKMRLTMKIRER